jgi:hypothetical protein
MYTRTYIYLYLIFDVISYLCHFCWSVWSTEFSTSFLYHLSSKTSSSSTYSAPKTPTPEIDMSKIWGRATPPAATPTPFANPKPKGKKGVSLFSNNRYICMVICYVYGCIYMNICFVYLCIYMYTYIHIYIYLYALSQ